MKFFRQNPALAAALVCTMEMGFVSKMGLENGGEEE